MVSEKPTTSLPRQSLASCWSAVLCWSLAAALLGRAIQLRDGLFEERAFIWLAGAIVLAVLPLFWRRSEKREARIEKELSTFNFQLSTPPSAPSTQHSALSSRSAILLLGLLLLWQHLQFYAYRLPGSWHGPTVWEGWRKANWLFYSLLTFAAISSIALLAASWKARERLVRRVVFPSSLVAFFLLGIWIIGMVPRPHMDVWEAQKAGLDAFLKGQNPYTSSFPDIYNNPAVYAQGIVKDGRVQLGFPYPPIALWMDLPGHLLGGDYRYSNLLAILLAAALIAYARPGVIGPLAAALFLFTPRSLFVLESGWTEPTVVVLLAAVVYAACRESRWTPMLLGILLASKQYLIFIAPCALLLIPRPWRPGQIIRWIALAALAALVLSLPLMLWDFKAFLRSAVQQAGDSPLRTDALSFLALWKVKTGMTPPTWLGFAAALLTAALAVWRLPRNASGFAAAVALVLLAFFGLGKFAFCNYYYLVIAALCAGVASAEQSKVESHGG